MEQIPYTDSSKNIEEKSTVEALKSNRFFKQEYIESLREDVVKDIFSAIAKKAGNSQVMEKFIPFKDIIAINDPKIMEVGMYYAEDHKIKINEYNTHIGKKVITKSITLAALIHEELHAVTNTNTINNSIEIGDTRQTGFQVETLDAITRDSLGKVWKDFNEGITELIMDDILNEYVKRTGDRKEFHLHGYELGDPNSTYQTYLGERALVNVVIDRVSTDSGVSKDVVREAFVQAYFSGAPLEKIKKDLVAISGEGLVTKIDTGITHSKDGNAKDSSVNIIQNKENQENEDKKNRVILIRLCTNFMKRGLAS